MAKQRRGWIWLLAGVMLAAVAGLTTFRMVNEVASSAISSSLAETAAVQILVANQDIPVNTELTEEMFGLQDVPVYLAPPKAATSFDQVMGKVALSPISEGEFLLRTRFVDPLDPDAPLLYTVQKSDVLVAIPSNALMANLGLLSVGDHVDIAYTSDFLQSDILADAAQDLASNEDKGQKDVTVAVTFMSLQNLEVRALPSLAIGEDAAAVSNPEAIVLAVKPQDALILKYLVDIGASMDLFLRAPGDDTLTPLQPIDQQFLIERFQLQTGISIDFGSPAVATDPGSASSLVNTILNSGTGSVESPVGASEKPASTD